MDLAILFFIVIVFIIGAIVNKIWWYRMKKQFERENPGSKW